MTELTSYNVFPSSTGSSGRSGACCPKLHDGQTVPPLNAFAAREEEETRRSYASRHSLSRCSFASSIVVCDSNRYAIDSLARAFCDSSMAACRL